MTGSHQFNFLKIFNSEFLKLIPAENEFSLKFSFKFLILYLALLYLARYTEVMSLIRVIYIFTPLITLLAGIYSFKLLDKKFRIVVLYVATGFCIELSNWLLVKIGVRNNMPGLHFYIMFEYLIWSVFYIQILDGYVKRIYLVTVTVLFEAFCVINMFFIQNLNEYPITRSVENLLLILLAVLFFSKVMTEAEIEKLVYSPLIWINSVVLLYFAGNFFYNVVFTQLLVKNTVILRTVNIYIFAIFNTVFYIGIMVGFLLHRVNLSCGSDLTISKT